MRFAWIAAALRIEVVFDACRLIDPRTLMNDAALVLVAADAETDNDRREVLGDGAFKTIAEAVITLRAGRHLPYAAQEVGKYMVVGVPWTHETIGTKIVHRHSTCQATGNRQNSNTPS